MNKRNAKSFRKMLKRRGDIHMDARNRGTDWIMALVDRALRK